MAGTGRDLTDLDGESRLALTVRPNDLDALGHVNHAVALEYLETGRWDWLDQHGIVPGQRVIVVVSRVEVDYLAELPRGEVMVHTRLETPTTAERAAGQPAFRARLRQCLHRTPDTSERPAVAALITVAFLDTAAGRPVSMQEFLATVQPDVAAEAGT